MTNKIIQGDCIEKLKELPDNSVDAIITDPPYGLEFMGKDWDKFKKGENIAGGTTGKDTPFGRSKPLNSVYQYTNEQKYQMQHFFQEWATECLRVLKPGGFLLAFGGTRTYHRLTCGIEDAGFEIRDTIMWLYGSGFPKSLNIGKQVDKIQGNEREYLGEKLTGGIKRVRPDDSKESHPYAVGQRYVPNTKGNSEWEGWGTALKPACEPIVVARKPLSEKNVALNILKHGTGGINIDACRIEGTKEYLEGKGNETQKKQGDVYGFANYDKLHIRGEPNQQGRFPANIILDEEAGKMLGESSRFFYCAKASKSERNFGCEDFEDKKKIYRATANGTGEVSKNMERFASVMKNNHPTVKPIKLMEYLIKLVSKEGATILDPFLGSGTTAIACLKLNRNFIGIEKEEEYIKIATARIKPFLVQQKL